MPVGKEKILFDFLKKRQYNYRKRVASKRKSSLPAARFWFAENKYRREKCVACQRKSNLYDRAAFFCAEKGGMKTKWQKVTR